MKSLPLFLAVCFSLGVAACDRRDEQPVEPSSTTDTAAPQPTSPQATTGADTTAGAATASGTAAEDAAATVCAGLSGQELEDCRMRVNASDASAEAPMTDTQREERPQTPTEPPKDDDGAGTPPP